MFRERSRFTFPCIGMIVGVVLAALPCFGQSEPQRVPIEGQFRAPRWSPDGQMLAVTKPGYRGIYVVKPDGSDFRKITDAEQAGYGFAWSPDSTKIAFKTSRWTGKTFIRTMNVANLDGTVDRIAQEAGDMGAPTWRAADSVGFTLNERALVVKLDGQVTQQEGVVKANTLSWSPGGNRILYAEQDRLVLLSPDGTRQFLTGAEDGRLYNPVISPSGGKAVVHNLDGHLYLIDLSTGSRSDLGNGHAASWSPDGQRIVCNISTDDGHVVTGADVVIIDAVTGVRTQFTNTPDRFEMYASWALDGDRIAYGDTTDGSIYVHAVGEGGN